MLPAVAGCVASPPIYAANTPCSSLVPADWRGGVPHAPAPAEATDPLDQLKAWIGFGTAEAGQVEKANGRTADTIGIIERCESRDREAVQRAKPKFLGLF
jgi:hypothetical protein